MQVLFVCSANRCRSPMAAALLDRHARKEGASLTVSSAGFGPAGYPAEPETVAAMNEVGIDLSGHRSRQVNRAILEGADLVVVMTKQHLIEAAVMAPTAWPRFFTLTDLVDRGRQIGPRGRGESPEGWVTRAGGGRTRQHILNLDAAKDIADPVGQPVDRHAQTRDHLDALTGQLARWLAPPG